MSNGFKKVKIGALWCKKTTDSGKPKLITGFIDLDELEKYPPMQERGDKVNQEPIMICINWNQKKNPKAPGFHIFAANREYPDKDEEIVEEAVQGELIEDNQGEDDGFEF